MVYIDKTKCIGCLRCVRVCPMGVLVPGTGDRTPEVHPRRRCIQCMHCAAGCPNMAVRFEEVPRRRSIRNCRRRRLFWRS